MQAALEKKEVEVQSSAKRKQSSLWTFQLLLTCWIWSLNSRQIMHLRSTKWVDWTCIEVGKSLLSICNKNQFKVNRSTRHTHGFTSADYCNLCFNWLFHLFLVTDPQRMLSIPYFGRNWSVCVESRTGITLFMINQHDIHGFIWQTARLVAEAQLWRAPGRTKVEQVWGSFFLRWSVFSPAFC